MENQNEKNYEAEKHNFKNQGNAFPNQNQNRKDETVATPNRDAHTENQGNAFPDQNQNSENERTSLTNNSNNAYPGPENDEEIDDQGLEEDDEEEELDDEESEDDFAEGDDFEENEKFNNQNSGNNYTDNGRI